MHFTALTASALASLSLFSAVLSSPIASGPAAPATIIARDQLLARQEPQAPEIFLKDDDEHRIGGELERVLGIITEIPDEVLNAGDEAADKWLKEHGYRPSADKRAPVNEERDLEDRQVGDVARCAGSIAAFIGTNLVGVAKLLRIKKYIAALGGVRESAELMLKASTNAERLREGGEALVLLAGEILGYGAVAKNC